MQAWYSLQQQLKKELGEDAYLTWVKPIKLLRFDAGNLYLELRDSFHEHWFEQYIRPKIKARFVNNNGTTVKIHVQTGCAPAKKRQKAKKESPLPFTIQADVVDPLCTLESFLVTKKNALPMQLITDHLGQKDKNSDLYNPYYFYGPRGCGKSHILMGIANICKQMGKRTFYVSAETFTAHFVQAIRLEKMEEFRKIYRHSDVLLVDDVDLLSRRFATQEEFFHTFNALHTTGKQIILSGNAPAISLEGVEDRLISRFEWGIALQIVPLEGKELIQMARELGMRLNLELSSSIYEWIRNEFTSTKAIAGAIIAIALRFGSNHQGLIELDEVQGVLHDLSLEEEKKLLTSKKIIEEVSKHFGIRTQDIYSQSKSREFSFPRQVAIYLCRMKLKDPYKKIGRLLGRDHSTIISSVQNIQKAIEKNHREVLNSLREIEKKLH